MNFSTQLLGVRLCSNSLQHKPDCFCKTMAALTYSTRRYDSAICCSKMSRDAFLSEVLYEADKALDKCACLQNGGRRRPL